MYTILFTIILSLLWLFYKYVEVQQRNIQEKILNLYIGNIETDIEQVIEKTASLSGQKLLLNNRYIRNIGSSVTQDSHVWSFPIMLASKPDNEEEGYIQQVFLVQLDKYIRGTNCMAQWSDKNQRLIVNPTFGDILRYNNQYHINLQLEFLYN